MTTQRGGPSARETHEWQSDPAIQDTLTDLANDRSLTVEIGALRLMLLRLLQEEGETARLAGHAARVAGVAVQAAKARHAIQGDAGEDTAAMLSRLLEQADDIPTPSKRKEER